MILGNCLIDNKIDVWFFSCCASFSLRISLKRRTKNIPFQNVNVTHLYFDVVLFISYSQSHWLVLDVNPNRFIYRPFISLSYFHHDIDSQICHSLCVIELSLHMNQFSFLSICVSVWALIFGSYNPLCENVWTIIYVVWTHK